MIPLAAAQRIMTSPWLLPGALAGAAPVVGMSIVVTKEPGVQRATIGLAYMGLLLLIALYDARTLRVPNRIVYPALGFAVAATLTLGWQDATEALLGGLAALALLLVIAIFSRGAMGYGDVKVGALCGMVVGLHGVLTMLMLTFISGALVAAVLLALRLRRPKDVIAFTPFLVVAVVFSVSYFDLYLVQ